MRITITIEDEVYREAQTLARSSGKPLGEVLSALIREGLRPQPSRPECHLPVF
ncbi:MAG: hypothetical protein ACYDCL_12715 [Myxococcales bacterium]